MIPTENKWNIDSMECLVLFHKRCFTKEGIDTVPRNALLSLKIKVYNLGVPRLLIVEKW